MWYTNFESRKAQDMAHNPYGALSFWWSEVQRAVRIEGIVCKVRVLSSVMCVQSATSLCVCVFFFVQLGLDSSLQAVRCLPVRRELSNLIELKGTQEV